MSDKETLSNFKMYYEELELKYQGKYPIKYKHHGKV